jgi:hypothetical protein
MEISKVLSHHGLMGGLRRGKEISMYKRTAAPKFIIDATSQIVGDDIRAVVASEDGGVYVITSNTRMLYKFDNKLNLKWSGVLPFTAIDQTLTVEEIGGYLYIYADLMLTKLSCDGAMNVIWQVARPVAYNILNIFRPYNQTNPTTTWIFSGGNAAYVHALDLSSPFLGI